MHCETRPVLSANLGVIYAYSPYGEVSVLGPDGENSLQYTGRENDRTGLYYYRARYYDQVLKRFVSEDPIGLQGGSNLTAYVRGNPTNYVDPMGLQDVRIDNAMRAAGLGGPESMSHGQGCGDIGSDKYVPDLYLGSCRKHDRCYEEGCKSKEQCDKEFFIDMLRERPWLTVYPAFMFYLGVRYGGEDAYRNAYPGRK